MTARDSRILGVAGILKINLSLTEKKKSETHSVLSDSL